jgi:tetratricopeptide (TPR) repeat protein
MERAIEIQPDDDKRRFLLAHKHWETGSNDLALFHYLKIREPQREGGTWNNLGVAFERAGLPAKAVEAYRQSEHLGETLAMSNLAQRFLSAGFLSEAREQCEKAFKLENFHQNVASTFAELTNIPDKEDKAQALATERAKPISDFYRQFGRAMTQPEPVEVATRWNGPDCDLSVKLAQHAFEAFGSYEQP